MTTRFEILAEIRARVARVIAAPGADRSDMVEGLQPARLPAFAVKAWLVSAERAGMGSADHRIVDRVSVAIMAQQGGGVTNAAEALAVLIRDAILADPADLGGIAWDVRLAGMAAEIEAGEVRIARAEIGFDVEYFGALA